MKKLDYLKLAIQNKCFYKRAWIVANFSITKEPQGAYTKDAYIGRLISEDWGYSFINSDNQIEKIDDCKPKEPLFNFTDRITIDNTWAVNLSNQVETTIGNLLFNHICIIPVFNNKFPFVLGRVSISKIEDTIAPMLVSTPLDESGNIDTKHERSNKYIYVDEYIRFTDSLQFLSSLTQLCCWSATPKSIVAPKGIKEFKQELLRKYEGKLNDPVELAKFEQELIAFDDQFLKDDPGYNKFLSGKVKNVARKKMFLNLGAELGFKDEVEVKPVINSLDEGWPTDPSQLTDLFNGLRYGSYSRGSETVKGGVAAKVLLRAGNNFSIEDTDCNSSLGIRRRYTDKDINQLYGRYIIEKNKVIPVKNLDEARNYLNRDLIVRSPMYCKLSGDRICRVCAGEKLFQYPKGITIPLTEISSIILSTALKQMHGTVLTTVKLDINQALT